MEYIAIPREKPRTKSEDKLFLGCGSRSINEEASPKSNNQKSPQKNIENIRCRDHFGLL